jgi:hypothetical protein
MKTTVSLLLLAAFLALPLAGYCQEEDRLYGQAVDAARAGDSYTLFFSLHSLMGQYPDTRHKEAALFGLGEYYFGISDYADASNSFRVLLEEFPETKSRIFCLGYLLEMAKRQGRKDQAAELEQAIANSRRVILIFKKSKAYTWRSMSRTAYKAVYSIDTVELYANGELFSKVSF